MQEEIDMEGKMSVIADYLYIIADDWDRQEFMTYFDGQDLPPKTMEFLQSFNTNYSTNGWREYLDYEQVMELYLKVKMVLYYNSDREIVPHESN